MNIRPLSGLLTAAVVLWAALAEAEVVTNYPYRGVTYMVRREESFLPEIMHIVVIDLSAPGIGFKLTPPGGTRDTVRQTTADFLNQEQAQVAINSHFFLPFPSGDTDANVVGFAASQGTVYSPFEPQPIAAGYADQSYAILPCAVALNIDPRNRASIVHHDPAFNDNKHVLEDVTLWNALSGSAQIVSNGVKTIPTYSGPPTGLNPIAGYSEDYSWYSSLRARTCIGLTRHNDKLVLFTVDEAGGSFGMTPGEIADLLMNDYQVYNALNLDGGGSTAMALRDPITHIGQIVNASSDNPAGRATGSNLAVFADPNPHLPLPLALTLAGSNTVIISWPALGTGWRLQENPGLNSMDWWDVSAPARCVGERMEVNLVRQEAGRFYRLVK